MIKNRRDAQKDQILDLLRKHPEGLTRDDVFREFGGAYQSWSARMSELRDERWIVETGQQRMSQWGKPNRVFVLR